METCQIEGCESPVFVKARGWCGRHYHRWHRTGDPTMASYDRHSGPDRWRHKFSIEPSGCWRWTASLDRKGYGQYGVITDGHRKNHRAHRYIYEQLVRTLADTEALDHLCRNRWCVNPAHLEPVSHAENVRRGDSGKRNAIKTHCPHGHPYDDENTRYDNRGYRQCKTCVRSQALERLHRFRGVTETHPNRLKTHCKHGHEFTPENTIKTKSGRNCRECNRRAIREYMRRKRALEKG